MTEPRGSLAACGPPVTAPPSGPVGFELSAFSWHSRDLWFDTRSPQRWSCSWGGPQHGLLALPLDRAHAGGLHHPGRGTCAAAAGRDPAPQRGTTFLNTLSTHSFTSPGELLLQGVLEVVGFSQVEPDNRSAGFALSLHSADPPGALFFSNASAALV